MLIQPDGAGARARAAAVTAAGGLVAFRTDTFYGLGADPFNAEALGAINALKGRDDKPILVLVGERADARRLLEGESELFEALAARHWPGPLTLVARARPEVPELLTASTGTVGVRLPDDREAREIVRACGGLLTATSANPSGSPPARSASEVAGYFPEGLGLIIDGGETRSELPSTVLDVSGEGPARLIREGALPRALLEESLRLAGRTLA